MNKSGKMMTAAIIAAALCIVPLFAAQDTDAAKMEEGDVGLSVSISSLSNANTDKLFSTDEKNTLAWMALAHTTDQDNLTGVMNRWTLSDVIVKDVKNLKESRGISATSSHIETVKGSGLECTVSFTATAQMYATQTPYLFEFTDGTQDLYDFIGSRSAPVDATLEVTGTLIKENYSYESGNYFKTKNGELCVDNMITENSVYVSFSGDVKYTFTQAGTKSVREYKVDSKSSEETKISAEFDYGKVAKEDVVGSTEVKFLRSIDKELSEREFRYVTGDNVKGGYRSVSDLKSSFMPTGEYAIVDAEEIWGDVDEPLPEFHYYGADAETCLFTDAQDAALKTDSGMSSFLKSLPDCNVSDSYPDAKSIADSTSISISTDDSGNGINQLFLYVGIGLLALLIIVLAVLVFRKKDAPKE